MKPFRLLLVVAVAGLLVAGARTVAAPPKPGNTPNQPNLPGGGFPAQTAQSLLQGYADWATKHAEGVGTYGLSFVMVSNQRTQIATYSTGLLVFRPHTAAQHAAFTGDVTELLSSHTYKMPPPPAEGFDVRPDNPFDPGKPEKITVTLDCETAQVTLAWAGGGTLSFTPQLNFSVLHGFGAVKGSPQALWAITLAKNFLATPK